MGRDWKKRMGCILLAVMLTVSNVQPVFATAGEDDGTGLCDHHMVHENCGYVEGEENSCTYSCALCIAEEKAIADQAATDAVSIQITALPTVDAVKEMAKEAQLSAYKQTQAAYTAYNALTEEQKALLPTAEEVFKPLFDYFNSLTAAAMDVTDSFVTAGSCGDLTWELDETGTLTISGEGEMPDYTNDDSSRPQWNQLREEIKKVVIADGAANIGAAAFWDCDNLKEVIISASVVSINNHAFSECNGLNSITIPDTVDQIEDNVFNNCVSLTSVDLPAELKIIEGGMFAGCENLLSIALPSNLERIEKDAFFACENITSITFPETVTSIGESAFQGCLSLSSVHIPASVINIESCAFGSCSELNEITVDAGNPQYASVGGVLLNKEKSDLIQAPGKTSGKYSVPTGVKEISFRAFDMCLNMTGIILPESIAVIEEYAFDNCRNLKSVKFKGDAPQISEFAFGDSTNVTSLTAYYPTGNTTWTEEVLQSYGNMITWVAYNPETGDEVPSLYGGTCGDLNWELENGVLTISGNGSMPNYSGARSTPWYEHRLKITKVVLEEGVKTVGECTFGESAVKSVELPNSVTGIELWAFDSCKDLKEITIPGSVAIIELGAFKNCSGLESITFEGDAPARDQLGGCFTDNVTATAYYPAGNETWTEEVRQSYGGTITWVAYNPDGSQGTYVLYPENGATEVGTVSASGEKVGIDKLTITFDKKIKKNSSNDSRALLDFTAGTIAIYRKDDDTLVWKAEEDLFTPGTAGTEVCVDSVQTTLVIEPVNRNNMFDFETQYYVVVDAGVISFDDGSTNDAITKGKWGFSTVPEPPQTCTLDELTSVDLLALADLCYSPSPEASKLGEITVREMLGEDKWERTWSSTDIKNSELFANVANWIVYDAIENDSTGFAAYTFKNNNDEFVVAYRGSEPLEDLALNDPDYVADWIYQNANAFFGGVGTQLLEAIWYPKEIVNTYGTDSVVIVGHSLGGALCDIVSARYGCRAESFNAAPFLANAYIHFPDEMGYIFSGRENWLFTDHITDGDFVGESKQWMKNYNVHEHSGYQVGTHSLASLIAKNVISNELSLTTVLKENMHIKSPLVDNGLYLGTLDDNILFYQDIGTDYIIYSGGGSDTIYAGRKSDTIVGGKGLDTLDGGHGGDYYFYYKNDGEDWIYDLSGRDILYLMGFSDTDSFSFVTDKSFLNIQCNGKEIAHIQRNRAYNIFSSFEVITHYETNPKSTNIAQYLTPKKYTGRYKIACPVSVEVIDNATGNVVHTMVNGESGVGAAYTDYGYFYVYQDESGEYVKVADLFEGYSLRIVGEDEGTMDVSVYEVTEDGLADPVSLTDVPVTDKLSATIEKKNDRKLYLIVDSDSDDETDEEISFDGDSGDDDTPGGDTSDDETPGDEAADIDDILVQLSGMTAQNVVPGDKTKILSILGSIEVLLAEEELTNEQRQLLTEAKETGEMLLDAIAALETAAKNVSDQITGLPATVEPDDEDAVAKIMAVKKAYDELDARAKALINAEQKIKLDALIKATTDYKIIKGNNGKWWKNSSRTLSFTVNAPFSKFESVEIDGKTIAESNYTAKSGSTIITLKNSYLHTLSTGEHTITVVFTDNEASGNFTIQKATSIPFTGDTFNVTLWISVMVVAGASLAVLLYRKRKQK